MTEDSYREKLTDFEYQVLRQGGTERPYTGEYWDSQQTGLYHCRACGAKLFESDAKFDARCGWPSFYQPSEGANVTYVKDSSLGMERTEVRCGSCESHLGHVFEGEGFETPTDLRYCINSISMRFEEAPTDGER